MPSLRRTYSSPAVRSSPYSLSSSLNSSRLVNRAHGHRRASGSDVSSRRVLADIDWWKVTEGQCDPDSLTSDAGEDTEERTRDDALDRLIDHGFAVQEVLTLNSVMASAVAEGGGEGSPTRTLMSLFDEDMVEVCATAPTNEFAALSIGPHSPTRRSHSRQSSISSSDSVDDISFDGLRLSIPDIESSPARRSVPSLHRSLTCGDAPSLFSLRAHTVNDCIGFKTHTTSLYADFSLSPLSASPLLFN